MTFSVVIPTHNRAELLQHAITTVIRQEHDDFEVIIFDNASDKAVKECVDLIGSERIKYYRSDKFLPVTDSWNKALSYAAGDYIVFLGDDDGLAPDYFSKVGKIITMFSSPEVIYSSIYQFFHPGVAPWEPDGYVAEIKNGFFFRNNKEPFILPGKDIHKAINGSVSFCRNFTFNIQAFTIHRNFIGKLASDGPVFRSPFPDYYFANVALAKAASIVVVPYPMSVAGVSKSSFGYTLFNDNELKGDELLNTDITQDEYYEDVKDKIIKGPSYNTKYLITMRHVEQLLSGFVTQKLNYKKYRRLQVYNILKVRLGYKYIIGGEVKTLWVSLSLREKIFLIYISIILFLYKYSFSHLKKVIDYYIKRIILPYEFYPETKILEKGKFSNVVELYDWLIEVENKRK